MAWSPELYTRFEDERNRPTRDLLAQVPETTVRTAVDLGCGPGNSTELLGRRFPMAAILGIDSSPEMIEAARRRLPGVRFQVDDMSTWSEAGPFDLILANASLQWVPDHQSLLPRLLGSLAPGGSLAVQVPDNLAMPAQILMREIALDGPWAERLSTPHVLDSRHDAVWYCSLLRAHGMQVNLWRTVYFHPLAGGPAAIVEWFKGTGLRPFLDPLDVDERAAFLARYEAALAKAYPTFADGTVLLAFPRLFFVATSA